MADKTFTSIQASTTFDHNDSAAVNQHQSINSQPVSSITTQSSSFINPISTPIKQSTNMERKHQIDITTTLMSPPEPVRLDNFDRSPTMAPKIKATYTRTNAFPMSPPVSPETRNGPPDVPTSQIITDPILYPNQDANLSSSQPLFENDLSVEAQRVVDGHVAARKASMFRESSPPQTSEYELALEFKSQVAKSFNHNRRLWFRRELAYLLEDKELQSGGRRYHTIAPAVNGGRHQRPPIKSVKTPKGSAGPRISKPQLVRQPTPNAEGKRVAREDKDFELLPDYCPPITSLPNKPNSLKVDWKGAPIDLRFDPHVHLLHPDEVSLAANLRLDCATYLTSKRRIFIKRIEALRIGKEFRKTDAQQACKIDVNKASKLWQAFEKVGWLNPSWVRKYA